jgi:hypothetical protein
VNFGAILVGAQRRTVRVKVRGRVATLGRKVTRTRMREAVRGAGSDERTVRRPLGTTIALITRPLTDTEILAIPRPVTEMLIRPRTQARGVCSAAVPALGAPPGGGAVLPGGGGV